MSARSFGLGFVRTIFFISAIFFILCGLYLILLGIFATRDFTQSFLWKGLLAVIGFFKLLIPNVIAGMTPPVTSVPPWWTRFTYGHAFLTLLFFALGLYLWRLRRDLKEQKPPSRMIAMIFCFFFAFYCLSLLILWSGAPYGPLMFVICLPLILIFVLLGLFLERKNTKALFVEKNN